MRITELQRHALAKRAQPGQPTNCIEHATSTDDDLACGTLATRALGRFEQHRIMALAVEAAIVM
jgi:hypothetical protein